MGAGSTTLLWYAFCIILVSFIAIVATGLIIYGQAAEARKRRAREAARAAQPPDQKPTPELGTLDQDDRDL